jgi:hypothetical protein
MDVSDMSVGNIVVIVVGRRTMFSSLSKTDLREFGVHNIPMFTFRERVEKVNNDLIIPISFLHTFQFPI